MTRPMPPSYPPPAGPPVPPPPRPPRGWLWRGRVYGVAVAALVVVGASVGVGMAVGSTPAADKTAMGLHSTDKQGAGAQFAGKRSSTESGRKRAAAKALDPAKQAWAHEYGQDRSTMPNLAPVATASAQQQAAATALLVRTRAATAQYADLDKARAAGYDLLDKVNAAEKKKPGLIKAMQRIDADGVPADGNMPMLHVGNTATRSDGKVLDPSAPETLMYGYAGHRQWMLMGVMYTAVESYPQAPPDPGGPITRWHYHTKSGGQGLMMHVFFVSGNDLAHAYATDLKA